MPSPAASSVRRVRPWLWAWVLGGVVISGLAGSFTDASPTGIGWWDAVLTGMFVAAVSAAAPLAPRWVWFVSLGVTTALASSVAWAVVGLAGLVLAFLLELLRAERSPIDVAVGMVVAHGLLQMRSEWFFGSASLVAGSLAAGLVALGLAGATPGRRRWGGRAVLATAVLAVLASMAGGVGALLAAADVDEGATAARRGLEAARGGQVATAQSNLGSAVASLGSARQRLDAWWVRPARYVPVLGQHVEVADVATRQAADVAQAAADALVVADLDQLRASAGRVDLDLVRAMQAPLEAVDTALTEAVTELDAASSSWLVGPVRRQLEDVTTELAAAQPDARKAAEATALLPGLLGGDGPRRYLVLFATPAESRELGGIVGNVVELTADDGTVSITAQLRNSDLNTAGPGTLVDPEAFPARYLINQPEVFSQNWTGMTDLPSVARAVAELYPTMGGRPIDGVLYADPYGVAALMELTGPVDVPGLGQLDADTLVPFLLVDQYREFAKDERVDVLDLVAGVTFARLVQADLPSPRGLGDALGPAARQGRLQMATFDDAENAFLDSLFLLGDLPTADGGDHLAVVHANGGADKLDGFLQRRVTYGAEVVTRSGTTIGDLTGAVTVALTNDVVVAGLPGYVTGSPLRETPQGTNRVHLSIYTPHQLESLSIDGRPVDAELQRELGFNRYLVFAEVAPGATVTVTFGLSGTVELSDGYRLTVAPQAVANPDQLVVDVGVDDQRLESSLVIVEDTVFSLDDIRPADP